MVVRGKVMRSFRSEVVHPLRSRNVILALVLWVCPLQAPPSPTWSL